MNKHAQALGKLGGSKKSERKTLASRKNGLLGGRPAKLDKLDIHTRNVIKHLTNPNA